MNDYISEIERQCDKFQIKALCINWQMNCAMISYLSIAALWVDDSKIADELIWLSFVYQAGKNNEHN